MVTCGGDGVSVLELFVLSTALAADMFSVAIPIGMNRVRLRLIFRAALVFALFHILMILAGYHAGHWLGGLVEHVGSYHLEGPIANVQNWATIFGALVLAGLGAHMIKEYFSEDDQDAPLNHPLRGLTLIVLAASVSIDALAAGFSMGMMDVDLLKLSLILGSVIFIIGIAGLGLGRRVGSALGSKAALAGGAVLLGLSLHILWSTFT